MSYGWECPRCGSTKAPWVAQCCGPRVTITAGTTITYEPPPHVCVMGTAGTCVVCLRPMSSQVQISEDGGP